MNSASSAEPTLVLRSLSRRFNTPVGELPVFENLDLDVAPGEFVALVGPSGSGKSSLLHAAGLLERPSGGSVRIAGVQAEVLGERARTRLRRRHVGFVYQFHHLIAEYTAAENVALPLELAGHRPVEARRRAQQLLEEVGLSTRQHHRPPELSGGEQQRVAIARAIANEPDLLLADEPTGSLDAGSADRVFALVAELSSTRRMAVLLATHNHALAQRADRTMRLVDGSLRQTR